MEKTDNELIAEFMGLRVHTSAGVLWHCDDDGWIDWVDGADPYSPDRSWNDLMPVVEKVASLKHPVYIYVSHIQKTCSVYELLKGGSGESDNRMIHNSGVKETPLQLTYKAVVEFIKWYRSQPGGGTVNMK